MIYIECIFWEGLYSCTRIVLERSLGKTFGCMLDTMNRGHDKIVFRDGRFRIWMAMINRYIIEVVDAVSSAR